MQDERRKAPLIVLGIDPGTRITGYGVLLKEGGNIKPLDFGCIRPPVSETIERRYLHLFNAVEKLIAVHRPSALSVETQFVYKNVQSAMKLGMARAAVLLAAARSDVPIFEYAPKKAKLAVVGNGGASKEQVQKMIQVLLKLPAPPHPEDAADALALAFCHLNQEVYSCLTISKEFLSKRHRQKQSSMCKGLDICSLSP